MPWFSAFLIAVCALALPEGGPVAVASPSQGASVSRAKPTIATVDALLKDLVARKEVGAAVALVWKSGSIVHRAAYGQRSLDHPHAVEITDRFRIASMTKPVTTAAALLLADRGRLRIDDPVSKFIPSFADLSVHEGPGRSRPAKRAMTVRHLMTHTSGLAGGFGFEPIDSLYARPGALDLRSLERYVDSLARLPLAADPGERWIYSYSTNVLGRVVEVASGQTLDVFLRNELLAPLGMDATGFQLAPEDASRVVDVNQWTGSVLRRLPGERRDLTRRPAFLAGNGGLISTADDYLRFALMLKNGGQLEGRRVLSPEAARSMYSDQLGEGIRVWGVGPEPMPGQRFGYGLAVVTDPRSARHPGAAGSFHWPGSLNTFFWVDPVNELVGILLMQYEPFRGLPIEPAFREAVYSALRPGARGPGPGASASVVRDRPLLIVPRNPSGAAGHEATGKRAGAGA